MRIFSSDVGGGKGRLHNRLGLLLNPLQVPRRRRDSIPLTQGCP